MKIRGYYEHHRVDIEVNNTPYLKYHVLVQQGISNNICDVHRSSDIYYGKKRVEVLYVRYEGPQMSKGELEVQVKNAIDIHVGYVEIVLLRLMTIRPDMKDLWRELPKYLTSTKQT